MTDLRTLPVAPPTAHRTQVRPDVQGLRAVAVLLVVGNHAHLPGFGGGYAGVDVFFVVSGFVITGLLLRSRPGLGGFWGRRIRRLVPAATATLVVTVVAARVVLGPRFDPALVGDVRWASLFGANVRLIRTGSDYFVPGLAPSLVTPFWSLAVEEQFYLLYPFVFLVAAWSRDRLRTLVLLLGPLVLLSAWWSAHTSATDPAVAYYSPLTRFWELGVGCLLAVALARRTPRRGARLAAGAGALGLALTLEVLPGATAYPGTLAWLPVTATALLLWTGRARPRFTTARLLSARWLVWMGDRSYALYLWHFLWLALPLQLASPPTGLGWRLLELAGAVGTAAVSYRWLEDPMRRSRRLAADPVATALLLVVCVAAVFVTTLVVQRFTP